MQAIGDRTLFCVIGEQAVCLDLRLDRYFCVKGPLNEALIDLSSSRTLTTSRRQTLRDSERRGVLRGLSEMVEMPPIRPVGRSLLDQDRIRTSFADYGRVVLALLLAKRRLTKGLENALQLAADSRERRSARAEHQNPDWRLPWAFEYVAPYMRSHDQCLLRSIALQSSLVRTGHNVRIVLGVSLRPFRAHCWVQYDDMVLNDVIDSVRAFTPIASL